MTNSLHVKRPLWKRQKPSNMEDKGQGNQLNVEISEDVASGEYANLAIINHSATEFVLDFIQVMPGVPKAKVRSRVILAPQHAKRILHAMKENVRRYEEAHGTIQDLEMPSVPLNFGPTGQA